MCGPRPDLAKEGPQVPVSPQPSVKRLEALHNGIEAVVGAMAGEVRFANENERAFALFRRGCHHCKERPEDLDAIGPKETILAFLARVAGRKSAGRQLQELGAILVQSTAWRELIIEAPNLLLSILKGEEQGIVAAALAEQAVRALAPPADGARIFLREKRSMWFLTVQPTASWVAAAAAAAAEHAVHGDGFERYDPIAVPWDHCDYNGQHSLHEERDDHFERGAAADRARCVLTEKAASLFVCCRGSCASSSSASVLQVEGPLCPNGHALQPWLTTGGHCDDCGREVWRDEQVLDCRECDWYLCQACHDKSVERSRGRGKSKLLSRRASAPAELAGEGEPGVVLGFAHEGVPALGRFLVARKPWPSSIRSALTGGGTDLELYCASKGFGRPEEFRWGVDATLQHVPSGLWLYVDPSSPGAVCLHPKKRSTWEALPAT